MEIDELRNAIQSFNLEEYVAGYGSDWVKQTERALLCPRCSKAKLIVNLEKRAWHCWSCEGKGAGRGGLLDLIQLLEGVDRKQAFAKVLHGFHGHIDLDSIDGLQLLYAEAIPDLVEIAPPAYCQWLDRTGILPYCQKRGISAWDAEQFRLMWCERGRYGGRLVFPTFEDGVLVYWQARAMWEQHENPAGAGKYIKSLNPPRAEGAAVSSDLLFNLDQASNYASVVITEGPIDAIHVGPDAVCTFGKRLFPAQVGKLLRAGVKTIELMWDGPSEREPQGAWTEMFNTAEQVGPLFNIRLVFLPRGDPGDYTREQLNWFRQHSSRPVRRTSRLMEI